MTYGLAGTSPFRDWETGPTNVLAEWLLSHYNATLTETPITSVQYAMPWTGDSGDFAIWFQRVGDYSMIEDLTESIANDDYYINIHIFVRSGYEQYYNLSTNKKSAEYYLDRFERWIRQTIAEYRDELLDEGILRIRAFEGRDTPLDSAVSSVNPEKEFDYHEIELKRRIIMIELKTQHINTTI